MLLWKSTQGAFASLSCWLILLKLSARLCVHACASVFSWSCRAASLWRCCLEITTPSTLEAHRAGQDLVIDEFHVCYTLSINRPLIEQNWILLRKNRNYLFLASVLAVALSFELSLGRGASPELLWIWHTFQKKLCKHMAFTEGFWGPHAEQS